MGSQRVRHDLSTFTLLGQAQKKWAFQVALVVKNLAANAGDIRDAGSIPGLGRAPRGGHGNPFQYAMLAWRTNGQRSLVDYSHGVTTS